MNPRNNANAPIDQTVVASRLRGSRPAHQNWTPWIVISITLLVGAMILMGTIGALALLYFAQERIPAGVSVAGIEIGGQSTDRAAALLEQNLSARSVELRDGNRTWQIALSVLGVSVDVEETIKTASAARPGDDVPPEYALDLGQTQAGLVSLIDEINIDAVPGNPPQRGRSVEIPVILDRLRVDAKGELADGVLELNMIDVEPPPGETVSRYDGEVTTHVVERGQELGLIAREYGVTMDDIVALNSLDNPDLIYPGQELLIPAGGVYSPTAAEAPPAPTSAGKAIVVSTGKQRIYAYENGQLVRSHLVSTGLPATPTVLGNYNVYVKYLADDMSGPDYFLPQVPYTMYFYSGYGIHGTYWHNSFGRPMSHGCVNLPVSEAEWFFNWAEVGTPVQVIV